MQAENGFVIIAADDVINPIIGYSHNSPVNDLPPALIEMLNDKAKQIHYAIENEISVDAQVQQK